MDTEPLKRYAIGTEILAFAAQGLADDQAHARPGPGAWSIAELVVHVVETDLVIAGRMRWVIAQDNPILPAFDESLWTTRLFANDLPYIESIDLMAASRRWMLHILRRLTDHDYRRAGTHTESGPKTLAELLVGASNHLDHHLRYLYGKRGNLGTALYPRFTRD